MSKKWPEFVYPIVDSVLRLRSILLGRGYPLHRNESARPFFIVGSGRCGTTLLRRILQVSPEVHIPPETYILGPAINLYRRNRDRPWKQLVRIVLGMFELHPDFDVFGVSLRPLAKKLIAIPQEQRSLAMILDSLYRYHGDQTGQTFTRWCDKTPLNSYHLNRIHAVFPDARFVHLLRDGADVVQSIRKAELGCDLDSAAERWKTAIAAVEAFARKNPSICCEIRYERLVQDPENVVKALCSFLDLAFAPNMLESLEHRGGMQDVVEYEHHANVFKPISLASIGKGRRDLSSEDSGRLHRIIGSELERLGYDPVSRMPQFDAANYWDDRLASNFDLQGVGRRNWGIHYNRWAYRVRRRVFLRLMKSLGVDFRTADTFDIGAGTGFYIDRWRELDARSVTGIDLTDVAVRNLRERYPASSFYRVDIGGDIGELRGRRFDAVSCMDVLFHIVDDALYRRAIENIFTLLKPGGAFVFTEGFIRGPTRRSRHVVHRGLHDIEAALRQVGFQIVRRQPFLVLMNDPVEPERSLLRVYWRLLQRVVERIPLAGAVAGAVLYPFELTLVSLLRDSPSTEIMLCRRPMDGAERARRRCMTSAY